MRAFNGEGCCMISCISVPKFVFTSELQGCREGDKVRLTWKNMKIRGTGKAFEDELVALY